MVEASSQYVPFTSPGNGTKGVLWTPASGERSHVAILLMHRTSNLLGRGEEWGRRGITALCMNPRFDNNEAAVRWEEIALDVGMGVDYLRKQPGITKVILQGGSGGGPTMTFYQAIAENGPSYGQDAARLMPCSDAVAGLTPADGIILVDAHPGNPANGLRSINPAVLDESRPNLIDPELDPFNPANGYNEHGNSDYPEAFKERYFVAQAERMNRLIDAALEKWRAIEQGKGTYPDDDVFIVPRGQGARMMQLDVRVHHSSVAPRPVLKNDGSVVVEVAESVRRPSPQLRELNASFGNPGGEEGGTRLLTVRSFLSANATRATHAMDGIDWTSTNNSTMCAVRSVSVPLLVTTMGAHYFIRDNELIYEAAASADKDFIMIEGATHVGAPAVACESFPGQYGNANRNRYDYMQRWLESRFPR